MTDPFDLLWPALAAVPGVLDEAEIGLDGIQNPVSVSFSEPVEGVFGGALAVSKYRIEYQTVDIPALPRGTLITLKDRTFKVSVPGRKTGDGRFSEAGLEEV